MGDRIIDQIAAVMEKLAEFPAVGRPRYDIRPAMRSFVSPPYLIFYPRKGEGIHVVRVLHERRTSTEVSKTPPALEQLVMNSSSSGA